MKFNQKLILGLSYACVILSLLVDTNHKSNLNISYNSVQSVVKLNGGGQNRSSESTSRIYAPQALHQNVKITDNHSSSVSNSKPNISTSEPGSKIKYFPHQNPGGSGSDSNGPETFDWETKASCPDPDQIISNIDFWNSYLDSKDCCPNIDIELEEYEDWSFEYIVDIPDDVLIKYRNRRKLFASESIPTGKLDKPLMRKHRYSNSDIQPFSFYSKEGKVLTIKNKELEKVVYAHSDDLDLLNFADRIVCPIQNDPSKYQRTECRAITDYGKKEALIRILELTTSTNPEFLTRKFEMPSYSGQDALAYIDKVTNACLLFHADSGNLWSAKRLSQLEKVVILNNPNFENLN